MKRNIALLLCLILLAALIVSAMLYTSREEPVENAGAALNADIPPDFLTYDGKEYPIRRQLQTVLFIGTDNDTPYRESTELKPYFNYDQADFLLLLVMDNHANKAQIIQINRDTMMDVPWLDALGRYGGTNFQQICLAFNSGDGGAVSCKNTVNAVSSLLFDAPIDHYIQIPTTGIAAVNDLLGGVPITFPEDYTEIDPAYTKGATVLLDGKQAERFVRARTELANDTNTARMARQRLYMDAFQIRARETLNSDSNFVMKLIEKLADFMQSDLTAQQMSDLIGRLDKADISPIVAPDGELRLTDYYEFYVDTDSLWNLVKNAYCE